MRGPGSCASTPRKAEAPGGVHAVLIGQELDYKLGLYVVDKDILAKDVVRHFGEAVAAVAAESSGDRQSTPSN